MYAFLTIRRNSFHDTDTKRQENANSTLNNHVRDTVQVRLYIHVYVDLHTHIPVLEYRPLPCIQSITAMR